MGGAGLLDIIQGRVCSQDSSSCPVTWDNFNSSHSLRASVAGHIQLLLSARRGSIAHLPDYGITELPEFDSAFDYIAARLAAQIKRYIIAYEPRISTVEVHLRLPHQTGESVVEIVVLAQLKDLDKPDQALALRFAVRGDGGVSLWR